MKRNVFIIDTNALISAFLVKNSESDRAFRKAAADGILGISDSLMSEFLEVTACRDADDNMILELAIASQVFVKDDLGFYHLVKKCFA